MGSGLSKETVFSTLDEQYEKDPKGTEKIVQQCMEEIQKRQAATKALQLARENQKFSRPNMREIAKTFDAMDYNGNNLVSLAEIDKYISERFPKLDHKPALMRAYKATDTNDDGLITRKEYGMLWKYIELFVRFWHVFESIDCNHDRRIEKSEFLS